MILIEQNGEQMLVTSLEGYDGCTVIESDVPDPPCDTHWCSRVDGEWIVDEAGMAAADENARLAALTPAEMIDEITKQVTGSMRAASVPNLTP